MKILQNILLSVISIVIFLMLLEAGSTVYIKFKSPGKAASAPCEDFIETPDSSHIFDTRIGYTMRPFYTDKNTKINSMGFRSSREFDFKDRSRGYAMILGDSMSLGYLLEQKDVFSEILNSENLGYYFVNTSVAGYTTAQEYLTLERYACIMKPAVAILFYYQANDLWENCQDNFFYPKAGLKDGKLVIAAAKKHIDTPFYKRLNLYRVLDARILHGMDLLYFALRLDFNIRGENSVPWRMAKKILNSIGDIARRENIKVIVIDIPTINQVKNPLTSKSRQKLLAKACKEENFLYYDLLSYYPNDARNMFRDWKHDAHWNEKGQRFIASFIKKIFSDNKFI